GGARSPPLPRLVAARLRASSGPERPGGSRLPRAERRAALRRDSADVVRRGRARGLDPGGARAGQRARAAGGEITAAASRRRIALTTVVLVALSGGALLRLAGIGFGLPDRFRPDEQYLVERAWGLGGEAGWNPRFAGYPAGQIYAIFGAAHAARAVGHGDWDPAREDGRSTWYLTGRLCTAALGIATIALAAWLAAAMAADAAGRAGAAAAWAASLAALLTAGAFLHVRDSHFATTDVPVGFWSVAALLSLARVLERARWRDSIASGALVGLATATKYPAATLLVPVAVAHFASARGGAHAGSARGCFRGRALRLAGALAASAIAFAATTPYVL